MQVRRRRVSGAVCSSGAARQESCGSADSRTFALEGALGALLWFDPLRYPLLVAGLTLHLGLQWFMRTRLFQWTMLTSLLLFLKPDDLSQWLKPFGLF